jgi:hypothetical protein
MLRNLVCILLTLCMCSCGSYFLKKRYSKGYAVFHKSHKSSVKSSGKVSDAKKLETEPAVEEVVVETAQSDVIEDVERITTAEVKKLTNQRFNVVSSEGQSKLYSHNPQVKEKVRSGPSSAAGMTGKVLVIFIGLFILACLIAFVFLLLILSGGTSSTLTPGFWWTMGSIAAAILIVIAKVAAS